VDRDGCEYPATSNLSSAVSSIRRHYVGGAKTVPYRAWSRLCSSTPRPASVRGAVAQPASTRTCATGSHAWAPGCSGSVFAVRQVGRSLSLRKEFLDETAVECFTSVSRARVPKSRHPKKYPNPTSGPARLGRADSASHESYPFITDGLHESSRLISCWEKEGWAPSRHCHLRYTPANSCSWRTSRVSSGEPTGTEG